VSERNCMFCKHLEYEPAGYGEYADPAGLSCRKGHFKAWDNFVYNEGDFRKIVVRAVKCPDYDEAKS
jgi:hypothetical protein